MKRAATTSAEGDDATFTEETIAEWKEAFSLFDRRHDGTITYQELGTVMRSVGLNPTDAELQVMINNDFCGEADRSGTIDFPGFLAAMARQAQRWDRSDEVRELCKPLDNGSGFMTEAELRHVLTHLGENLTEEEVEEIIQQTSVDGTGRVSYDAFLKLLSS